MRTEHTLVEFTFAYYPKGSKVVKGQLDGDWWAGSSGQIGSPEDILDPVAKKDQVPGSRSLLQPARIGMWPIEEPDSEFIEDGICLLHCNVISGGLGHYGCNLEAEIENATLGDALNLDDVFALATEEWAELISPKPPAKKPNETSWELLENSTGRENFLKEVPVTFRVLTLWSYSTWHDSYTGEYNTECELDRVVTMGELLAGLKELGHGKMLQVQ
jgi:hypothetical protein